MRTWVFLQTCISTHFCSWFYNFDSERTVSTLTPSCFAFSCHSENLACRHRKHFCVDYFAWILQEWFPGACRVLMPLGNSFKQRWLSPCFILSWFSEKKGDMSNHKGGGMASKERLYELWMLYYTKVSASAEELTVTPVAAAPLFCLKFPTVCVYHSHVCCWR